MRIEFILLIGLVAYYLGNPELARIYPILKPQQKPATKQNINQDVEVVEDKKEEQKVEETNGDHLFPDYLTN